MKMRILENPPLELWSQVVSQCDYATFFHTPTWAQIITSSLPKFHLATKGFVLDDGVIAIVPMVATVERNRYFKWCESMYPGGYGGAVAKRPLTQAEITAIYEHLLDAGTAHLHIMGNPYTDHDLPASYTRSSQFTHVLPLARGIDAIVSDYSAGHKYSIKKAKRLGVRISVAKTEAEYKSYYEVYIDSLRRWGENALFSYPYALFEQIYRHRSESVQLWVAKLNDEIVTGSLILYHNDHVDYWHTANRASHMDCRAGPLLVTEIIRDACQKAFRYFDFNPSGGLKGVESYKEGFGAQKVEFYSYVWQDNRLHYAYKKLLSSMQDALRKVSSLRHLQALPPTPGIASI